MPHVTPGWLQWRCRRGMRELDLLLGRWLERRWPLANADLRGAFLRLLDEQDPRIAGWLLGEHCPDDPPMAALIRDIVSCHD